MIVDLNERSLSLNEFCNKLELEVNSLLNEAEYNIEYINYLCEAGKDFKDKIKSKIDTVKRYAAIIKQKVIRLFQKLYIKLLETSERFYTNFVQKIINNKNDTNHQKFFFEIDDRELKNIVDSYVKDNKSFICYEPKYENGIDGIMNNDDIDKSSVSSIIDYYNKGVSINELKDILFHNVKYRYDNFGNYRSEYLNMEYDKKIKKLRNQALKRLDEGLKHLNPNTTTDEQIKNYKKECNEIMNVCIAIAKMNYISEKALVIVYVKYLKSKNKDQWIRDDLEFDYSEMY